MHEPHIFRSFQCSQLRQNSPLFPIISHLEQAAGIDRDDEVSEKLGKVSKLPITIERRCGGSALIAELLALPIAGHLPASDFNLQDRIRGSRKRNFWMPW